MEGINIENPKLADDKKFVEEDFKKFESKVENLMQILQNMTDPDKEKQEEGLRQADSMLSRDEEIMDEENFIVKVRQNRTVINNKTEMANDVQNMDKFTFMQQVENDAKKREEIRNEQEKIAQNFRKLGNDAFRKQEYEKAINMYTKAIDHVKDSPILYNNRGLSYIRLKLFKRAIIDCDFVINKLDEKNLRAWLYRATAYYHLDDEKNFEKSVKIAKKNNSKEIAYIEKYIADMKNIKL